jgi:hypothetical protein
MVGQSRCLLVNDDSTGSQIADMVRLMYRPFEISKIEILNNLKLKPGTLFDKLNQCEFCGNEHKNNCDFRFTNESFKTICQQMNTMIRPSFVLVAVTQQIDKSIRLGVPEYNNRL